MALLAWLHARADDLGLRVQAAHLHHGIAEARSDEAAEAVRDLCKARGIPLHARRVDVPRLARRRGLGIEAAGRLARASWFRALARKHDARVATAHTADDQAETVLMRLLRGSGTRGLRGVLPRLGTPPWLVRPFLVLRRDETRALAMACGLPVVDDPTNLDASYGTRNRVRLDLLPLLARDFNPRVVDSLCRLASAARNDDALLGRLARRAARRHVHGSDPTTVTDEVSDLPRALRARLLAASLRDAGGQGRRLDATGLERLESLLRGPVGRRTRVAGRSVHRTSRGLEIGPSVGDSTTPLGDEMTLPVPGEVRSAGWIIRTWPAEGEGETSPRRTPTDRGYRAVMRAPWRAALVASDAPLRVRGRRPGDRWRPPKGSGSCKVKATLNAWRVPLSERDTVPVVTVGDDVACIAGWGVDERRRPASGASPVVQLEFTFADEES